ncbi:uncharacterized protein LOC131332929 [Rhododendron vialii]|uniref:uncharacterized protein LOC131332929 n=1 Tax=Rhododendron vialii TaxID=182163 RepID=UPI00265F44C2|nr:uncharacterized protein LOC131332929 [Rhododendron vialii]
MDKKEKKNDKKKGLSPVKQKKNDNKENDKKKNIQEEEVEDEDEEKEEEEEEQVHKPTKKEANQKSRCSPKTRGKQQKQQRQVAKRTTVKTQKKKGKKKVKKEVKEEVKPKPKQIQYRSSFQSFVKLLKDIKFTTLHKEKIRKTPFANLIFALVDESLTEAYLRKSDLHALSLIRRYEGSGGRFNLGTKSVKITAQEFALVFGIPYGPNRIKPTTKPRMPETRFANEICVRGGRIMTNSSLKEYFQKAVKKKDEESANDVARVLTLYLISTVFLPSTASRVSWNLIEFIEDLDRISFYDWATFFTDELIRQLNDNMETPASTGGCISGLLYWFCEHVKLVSQGDPTNFPRFVKWRLTDLSVGLANNPLDVLDPLIVNDSKLEATELEKEMLGFVEVPEDDHVKPEDGDDPDHDDANTELQKENEILREKIKRLTEENEQIKRLTEENEQKDATIAQLQKRISELQDETYEETVAELNFEVDTAHVERDFFVKEVEHKEVEICSVLVENDIIAEKLERAEGTIDDIETHIITQQFKTSESVEEEEEEEEKEEECGPEHQMVPDEEVERTTIEAFTGVLAENSPKPTKKKRKQVDPSSLVQNVKNETRIEKREDGFVYEDLKKVKKNKQEEMDDVIPKWKVEKTKLGKLLEEEDKALLNLFYDLNQGQVNEEVWTDNETTYTITFKSIIKLLDELDMGNEVIDGYTSMLKREQEVKQLMQGNSAFFTSTCWVSTLPFAHNKTLLCSHCFDVIICSCLCYTRNADFHICLCLSN